MLETSPGNGELFLGKERWGGALLAKNPARLGKIPPVVAKEKGAAGLTARARANTVTQCHSATSDALRERTAFHTIA